MNEEALLDRQASWLTSQKRPQSLLMAFTRQARNLEGDFQISFQQLTTKITDRCHHLESRASNISSPPNVQRSTEVTIFFQFGQNFIRIKALYRPSFLREIDQLLVHCTKSENIYNVILGVPGQVN